MIFVTLTTMFSVFCLSSGLSDKRKLDVTFVKVFEIPNMNACFV